MRGEEPYVVIGLPHVGDLPGYVMETLFGLIRPPKSSIIHVEGKDVALARNLIVKQFLTNSAATHLFFMDADMIFPREALVRLAQRDKDVIGGVYFARTDTPIPHVYDFVKEDEQGRRWYRSYAKEAARWLNAHPEHKAFGPAHVFPMADDGLMKVDAMATGCLLIRREVLEAVGEPWFECWPGTAAGEDFDFCAKARAKGFDVWADFTVQCGHEMRAFVARDEFIEAYQVGTPDEFDFDKPILVEAGPSGQKIMAPDPQGFTFPEDVEGYLTHGEGRLLYELACKVQEDGQIVELGSYKGKSTICLAQSGRRVLTIDSFVGEPVLAGVHTDHRNGSYNAALIAHLQDFGVSGNVTIRQAQTWEAGWRGVGQPVDLLFIDADHEEGAVRRDLEAWEPNMAPDGVIAFHDVNWPGVAQVVSEAAQRGWRHVAHSGSLVALKKG